MFPFAYKGTLELPGSAAARHATAVLSRVADGLKATTRCKWVRLGEDSIRFRSGIFVLRLRPHPLAAITSGIIRVDRVAGAALLSYQLSFTELILYSVGLLAFWTVTEALMGRLRVELFQTALWVFMLFFIGNLACAIWWFTRFLRRTVPHDPS